MRIKKGDNVVVLSGKDKGKKGRVVRALPSREAVIVEGMNIRKKHEKQSAGKKGGIVEYSAPLHVSNVAIADPKTGKATRVGVTVVDGKKLRITKQSGAQLK